MSVEEEKQVLDPLIFMFSPDAETRYLEERIKSEEAYRASLKDEVERRESWDSRQQEHIDEIRAQNAHIISLLERMVGLLNR